MDGRTVMISISPATVKSSSGNGSTVDLRAQGVMEIGKREMAFILDVGAVSSGTTLDVHLESSPNDSTWTDIPDGAFAQVTTAAAVKTLRVKPPARYIRAVHAVVGTSYTFSVAAAGTKLQTP